MKITKILFVAGLISLIFATSLAAASQELSAAGGKNLRSGNMHLSGKRFEKALPLYESVLEENPHNIEAMQNVAAIYYDNKMQYAVAYDYYTLIIAEIEDLFAEYETKKQTDEKAASKFYKKQIKKPKYNKVIDDMKKLKQSCWIKLFNKGQEFYKAEAYEEALAEYETLKVMAPDSIKTHKMIAMIYTKKGDTEKAIDAYKNISNQNPADMAPIQQVAALLYGQEKFAEAADWYIKAIELDPSNIDDYYNAAICYSKAENNVDAFTYYAKTVEIDPTHFDAIINASNSALANEDVDNQLLYLGKASEIDPGNLGIIQKVCYGYVGQQKYKEALPFAEKLKLLLPDNADIDNLLTYIKSQVN